MNPLFNTELPVEERAKETIKQMTLEEKVSQLVYKSAAIERLGIPAYHWWNECLHGVATVSYTHLDVYKRQELYLYPEMRRWQSVHRVDQ